MATKIRAILQLQKKPKPVPMFNQPLPSACPHHRLSRILFAVSLSLLIGIAIPVITLRAITYSFLDMNQEMGFVFDTAERDDGAGIKFVMAALPKMLFLTPAKVALVAAVLSIFTAMAHLGFVVVDWTDGKRTQSWAFRRNIMFVHIMNSILILFALVSIYVAHKSSSHFKDNYVDFRTSAINNTTLHNHTENFFRYNIGTFDLETWSCELKDVRGASMVQSDYAKQCSVEFAGRVIMIPFVIFAFSVAATSVWGLVGGGRRGPDGERVKTEDIGLEMGKMNAI